VDVRALNDAPLTFRYHALKGRPLVVRDQELLDEMRFASYASWPRYPARFSLLPAAIPTVRPKPRSAAGPRAWAPDSSIDFTAHSTKVTSNFPGSNRFVHRVIGTMSLIRLFFWAGQKCLLKTERRVS